MTTCMIFCIHLRNHIAVALVFCNGEICIVSSMIVLFTTYFICHMLRYLLQGIIDYLAYVMLSVSGDHHQVTRQRAHDNVD